MPRKAVKFAAATAAPPGDEKKEADPLALTVYETSKSNIPQRPLMESGYLLKHPHSWMFCAVSGGGKTQLMLNLLKKPEFYGPVGASKGGKDASSYFDHVFVWSETAGIGADDLYEKHLADIVPKNRIYVPDEKGLAVMKHILQTQKAKITAAHGDLSAVPRLLFIFDDVAHSAAFLASREYLLMHIANRHFNASCWTLTQSYVKVPRSARIQVSGLCFFWGATGEEIEHLADEHTPPGRSKHQMRDMIDYALQKKHDFMFINKHSADPRHVYRIGFEEALQLDG